MIEEIKVKPSVGVSNLHFAKMLDVGTKTSNPTFDIPIKCTGLVETNLTIEDKNETFWHGANNYKYLAGTINITKAALSPEMQEYVLGREYNNGVIEINGDNQMPLIAVLWESLKSNGKHVRKCCFMTMLTVKEITDTTKTDSIEFNTMNITGQVYYTLNNRLYRECDEENDSSEFDGWFDAVPL